MALFRELNTIALSSGFQGRVEYALQVAAIAILTENPATPNHDIRRAFAVKAIEGQAALYRVALTVLTNVTIATEANVSETDYAIPDGDIQFAVNSVFDSLASVFS